LLYCSDERRWDAYLMKSTKLNAERNKRMEGEHSGAKGMYQGIRNVHLLMALIALPMLLMYGVSAVQMAHHDWFPMKPQVSEAVVQLALGAQSPREVARELMVREGWRGEIDQVQVKEAGATLSGRVVRPGCVQEFSYEASSGATKVTTRQLTWLGFLNRLHHAAGVWPEWRPLLAWTGLVVLASVALLGVGATGIYLWWQRRQERRWGLVLLSVNLVFCVVLMMMARAGGP
jgi:hypothetical protein